MALTGKTSFFALYLTKKNNNNFARNEFYIHGSVHRESNLITAQQDATYSVYYISVGSSTYFGC
jgi:hypothetical protein